MTKIITRFPPSPTGEIHIGNMRTMLFNYLFAKHHNGEVFLRFEDTDRERSDVKFEKATIDGLAALGLQYDHGPFRQSERGELYKEKLLELIKLGHAYEAEESSDGSGNKVIRFKNPNKTVIFNDGVRGEISIESEIFGDFVIARSLDSAIYHFAVVVDDMDMGITHIIRGEDHITSTPRQILLIDAFGGKIPTYAHLPLILGSDNKKLSKRHGAASVSDFMKEGYLPQAIVNYLAFLGWNPGDEREIFSLEELVKEFSLEKVGKSGARFDYIKLSDINHHYMSLLSKEEYKEYVLKFLDEKNLSYFVNFPNISDKVIQEVIRPRLKKFSQVSEFIEDDGLEYYFKRPTVVIENVSFKDTSIEKTKESLTEILNAFSTITADEWAIESIKNILFKLAEKSSIGAVMHPLRVILSGKKQSPDSATISYILGKEETLNRINLFLK